MVRTPGKEEPSKTAPRGIPLVQPVGDAVDRDGDSGDDDDGHDDHRDGGDVDD